MSSGPVIYVVVMLAVCAAGYRLYINQPKHEDVPQVGWAVYWPALRMAIIEQSIFVLFGTLTLDMG